MPDPLVSVVVPVHDGERHLAAALDSVLAQAGPRLDVVVVDDASRDASAAIAARYADRGVRLVRLDASRGAAGARNAGVAAARGEWLAFLDADDEWTPGRLRAGLDAFAADPGLDACFGHALVFHDDGAVAPATVPGWSLGTLLVRRPTWDRLGGLVEVRAGELMDWLLRAREAGLRERMLADVLLRRRVHAGNSMRDRTRMTDYAHVLKAALDRRRAAS